MSITTNQAADGHFTTMYASSNETTRETLWHDMDNLANEHDIPWLL